MSDKTPAPDPEIPDAIRSRLSKSNRPAGFAPRSPEAEEDNAKEEVQELGKPRDLRKFFKALAAALKVAKPIRPVTETKDVKRGEEWFREVRTINVPVELTVGADGLPYAAEAVSAEETHRVRALNYKDAPKMDPQLGDLTPAFVEWLYLNKPYDASVRYFSRSTHVQSWALAHA